MSFFIPRCLVVLVLAAGAVAQVERPIPYPIPKDRAWQRAVSAGTRTETGVPGKSYWTDRAEYKIKAELIPETAMVKGHIDMTYHNRSPRSVRTLNVHLRQNLYKAGSLRNRFVEITGGMKVSNVKVGDEELSARRYRVRGTIMSVRLPRRLGSDEKVTLSMDWEFQVPVAGMDAMRQGYDVIRQGHENHHVFYLGYWYPQFAVHEDVAGWVAEQYLSNAEFYMDYADYDLELTVPEGWLVRATGTLENADEVLTKTELERLKKARAQREVVHVITSEDLEAGNVTRKGKTGKTGKTGKLTWRFAAKNVRDVAVSASDRYVWDATHAVIKDRDGEGKDGTCMIHAVFRPGRRPSNGAAAEQARHTIEFMSKTVYPYPWPHMTACQGVIFGGMEYPMMTIIGPRFGLGVITHELIHMWFPMLVGSNEKAHAWQDEGFTSFFTSLAVADFRGRELSRRIDAAGYLRTVAGGQDSSMMRHGDHYGGGRGSYGFASYGKTAAVLQQLRGMVGDDVFFKAMRKYAADWAYRHPYPQDFFNTFSSVAKEDLDWYFRIWFYETWTLDQAVASVKEKGQATEVVIQDRGDATYPTRVQVQYSDGRTEIKSVDVRRWLAGKRTATLTFGSGVTKVVIDPERVTLDIDRSNNTWKSEGN
jgi:Peptidase family M1 domain